MYEKQDDYKNHLMYIFLDLSMAYKVVANTVLNNTTGFTITDFHELK